MDVSGIPVLRGGGGPTSKERGLYAVLVCIFLFTPVRARGVEENDRTAWEQGRSAEVEVEDANRKTIAEGVAKGTRIRCADMATEVKMASVRRTVFVCGGEKKLMAFVIKSFSGETRKLTKASDVIGYARESI